MKDTDSSNGWTIFGSIGAALAAAVCCLGPVVLVSLGVTGAWIGNLSALEPYRPLFAVAAAGFLGIGFYRVYGRSSQSACGEQQACEVPEASRINRVLLWMATLVVAGLFASPYLFSVGPDSASAAQAESASQETSGVVGDDAELATVILEVDGMTCGGCASTVQSALEDVDGVDEAEVSYEPPRARVVYDTSKVTGEELIESTAAVGYPSTSTGGSDE